MPLSSPKIFFGELNCGETDRNRTAGYPGAGADFLGDEKRTVQKAVENGAGAAVFGGDLESILELTENLGLTDDHRIQA